MNVTLPGLVFLCSTCLTVTAYAAQDRYTYSGSHSGSQHKSQHNHQSVYNRSSSSRHEGTQSRKRYSNNRHESQLRYSQRNHVKHSYSKRNYARQNHHYQNSLLPKNNHSGFFGLSVFPNTSHMYFSGGDSYYGNVSHGYRQSLYYGGKHHYKNHRQHYKSHRHNRNCHH